MDHFYSTYVLQSSKDGNLYIGWPNNLKGRLKKHRDGKVDATKFPTPLKLIYFESCLNKTDATKQEKTLKSGFGRKYLKNRLLNYIVDTSPQKLSL